MSIGNPTEELLRWELAQAVKRIVELEELNQQLIDANHELRERIEDISL